MAINTIFREYDIRGIFDKELDEKTVKLIGYFLALKIQEKITDREKEDIYVAIGYDARLHSPVLRDYLISGFNKAGIKVLDMGLVATPVNYFSGFRTFYIDELDTLLEPNASIMITGSHNPSQYNGFKITVEQKPFFADDIYDLRDIILENYDLKIEDNTLKYDINTKDKYINYIVKDFQHLKNLNKKIILDGGNGVVGTVITKIFDELGLDYDTMYIEPDGSFPNHHPDPSVEENLVDIKAVLPKYDIGFAYDGDADRVVVLTNKNQSISSDLLAIALTKVMAKPLVVSEVKCSQVMYDEIEKLGGEAVMYKTGHSNIKVKMLEIGADLGVEVSGHMFFADTYFGYDDAIYATLRVLELSKLGIDIDEELALLPQAYSTSEIKIDVKEDNKFEIINTIKLLLAKSPIGFPKIKKIVDIDGVRVVFQEGWALVRASNTTPVLVTRYESTDENKLKLYQEKMATIIDMARKIIEGK